MVNIALSVIKFFPLAILCYPANTGNPIVAVLINAPAKIRKGSKGYFSIMGVEPLCLIGNYTILGISTASCV